MSTRRRRAPVEPPLQAADDPGQIVAEFSRFGERGEDFVIVGGAVTDTPLAIHVDLALDEFGKD